jgi:hypothetical protein
LTVNPRTPRFVPPGLGCERTTIDFAKRVGASVLSDEHVDGSLGEKKIIYPGAGKVDGRKVINTTPAGPQVSCS